MFLLIVMYALLASTFSIAWSVMQYAQPFFTIGVRMVLAGIMLLGYQFVFRRSRFSIAWRDRWLFVQATFFHIFFAFVTEFHALKTVSGAKTALMYNLSPFIAAIFSYVMFREQLSRRQWMGLVIGFLGFIPLLYSQAPTETSLVNAFFISRAEGELLISVVSAVYGWLVVKKLVTRLGYAPVMVNGVAMLGAGVLSLLCSLVIESWSPIPVRLAYIPKFFFEISTLILIANIVYYNLFAWLLRFYTPTFLTFVGFVTPLFAALYDWIFFGKTVSLAFGATALSVFCGLYIFYKDSLTHARLR